MRREFEMVCADHVKLYARAFECDNPRAAICVAHGLGEHGDRYQKFAEGMNKAGFNVYVHDHRGHGHNVTNDKQRGIARMRDLERDMLTMLDFVELEIGLPVFLFGHSLGGNVALFTALNTRPNVQGIIITSPWLKLKSGPPSFVLDIVGAMAGMVQGISIANGPEATALCHDKAVCAAYEADPYTHGRIGLGLAGDAHRAAKWVLGNAARLNKPLLLCHGAEDGICDVQGSREFAAKAQGVRYVEFPHAFHEIHNEPEDQQKLFETEIEFIEEVLRG